MSFCADAPLCRVYTSATCCGQQATCCAQHDACCPQQVACCAQLVARNLLRWCKRGIRNYSLIQSYSNAERCYNRPIRRQTLCQKIGREFSILINNNDDYTSRAVQFLCRWLLSQGDVKRRRKNLRRASQPGSAGGVDGTADHRAKNWWECTWYSVWADSYDDQ